MTVVDDRPEAEELYLPDGWRDLPDDMKAAMVERLSRLHNRAHPEEPRHVEGSWDRPSDLAADLFPGYLHSPHLDLIDSAFLDADAGKVDRILICTPPQVGKSTTAAEAGPLWWLNRHKAARVTLASYASGLAERRGERCRDMILAYGDRLGLALARGSRAVAEWDLTTGGGMICMGVGGGLTGFGSDFMVVDDPHKNREEANSKRLRDAVAGWYLSTVETRLSPGAPVILIMTRWHEDDLAFRVLKQEGRVETGGRWKVISLPAVAEGRTPKGDLLIDPLDRQPGDPLTHPKLPGAPREVLLDFWRQKQNAVGTREWISLYQQRPAAPEGTIWKWDWIERGRIRPEEIDLGAIGKRIVAVDPSVAEDGDKDECGIVVMGRGDVDRIGYVLEDCSGQLSPLEWGVRVIRAALRWDAVEIVAEKNQGGGLVKTNLRAAWREICDEDAKAGAVRDKDRPPYRVVLVPSRVGKRIRAEPVAALYEREPTEVRHVGDHPELEDQLTGWTGEDNDSPDRLDALVHGATYLLLGLVAGGSSSSVADLSL